MTAIRQIEKLYENIPAFECIPGCTDCCGPVPFARSEWDRIEDKKKPTGLSCPYAVKGQGCSIYKDRPFMCRLFGATSDPQLTCPHGRRPAHPLSPQVAALLTGRYINLMDAV